MLFFLVLYDGLTKIKTEKLSLSSKNTDKTLKIGKWSIQTSFLLMSRTALRITEQKGPKTTSIQGRTDGQMYVFYLYLSSHIIISPSPSLDLHYGWCVIPHSTMFCCPFLDRAFREQPILLSGLCSAASWWKPAQLWWMQRGLKAVAWLSTLLQLFCHPQNIITSKKICFKRTVCAHIHCTTDVIRHYWEFQTEGVPSGDQYNWKSFRITWPDLEPIVESKTSMLPWQQS